MAEKFDGSHRRQLVEEFEKTKSVFDKLPVEVTTGGRWKMAGDKIVLCGGTTMKMTMGLYRKLFPEKD